MPLLAVEYVRLMKLHRICILKLDTQSEKANGFHGTMNDVDVEVRPTTKDGAPDDRILIIASVDLPQAPTLNEESQLIIPEDERRRCELAIETTANLLSVIGRTGRRLASAMPSFALSDLTEEDRNKLSNAVSLDSGYKASMVAAEPGDIRDSPIPKLIGDRIAGLALMAEVESNQHPVGRFRALLRFFELAFSRPTSQIDKKLYQFLDGSKLGYSREEVKSWLALRHGAMHGDMKKAQELIMESDVMILLPRMEQAAYDVLYNKEEWHSPSHIRRKGYNQTVATTDSDAKDLRVTKGKEASISAHVFDPFGAFPIDLLASMNQIPEGWWTIKPKDDRENTI